MKAKNANRLFLTIIIVHFISIFEASCTSVGKK